MSVIIEKNLLAHVFYNPDTIERMSLNGEHFSDVICRGLYTKLKQKHEESGGYEFINKELLPLLYENNKSIFEVKGIQSFGEVPKYIFSEYDRQSSFDWMYSENILREQFRKRQYSEVFERALEELEESNIDTVRSNLDMKLSSLDKEDPKDSSIVQGSSFLEMYNTRTKEIDELRKSKKPTHYTPSHPVAQKYARMKKGWFSNIVSGCVDMDTEFFDGKGWKKISDYQEGDKVLQYNEDGTSELVLPSKYHKYESEYLTHFKTKYGVDQCLSDEHNVIYFSENTGKLIKKPFADVKKDHENNTKGFRGRFKVSSNYVGGSGINLSDSEIKLMVAVIADGSYGSNNTNFCRFHIKKDVKKVKIERILRECGIEYKKTPSATEGYHDYYFTAPMKTKVFTSDWYNCTVSQLKVIADNIFDFDGSYDNRGCENSVGSFYSTVKENADFAQFVFSSLGYKASINEQDRRGRERNLNGKIYTTKSIDYKVVVSKRSLCGISSNASNKTKMTKYKTKDGFKYCFTVNSGMLVLRRNDNIFVTGNSGGGKSLALCQEAVHHSKVYDERVLFITDENSDEVILTYMYCNYLGLKYHEVEDRKIDLDEYIATLPEEEKKEIARVFTNIDVIELSGIPTVEVRNMLSNARNLDNPYGWVGIDSFDEMNIDANLDDFTRQNQNAIMCERIAKDYKLILWVTSQLKTDYYTISIEKMPMTANHGAKTLIKKSFLSIILWWEFSKDEEGDQAQLGFRGKLNKCRSGGMGKIYEIEQNYDYCRLIASEIEIGEGLSSEDTF